MGNETRPRQTDKTKSSQQGIGVIAFLSSELATNTEAPQNLFGSYEQRRQSTAQRDTGEPQRSAPPAAPETADLQFDVQGNHGTDGRQSACAY